MKKSKKSLVLLLIFALALSLFPQSAFAAKKKVKLDKKSVTVNVAKTVKIKLQNNKKKVKWTVTSGKKNLKLSKKKKTEVTIKGKKAGKAKVQAKVGKKKYVCKVTVKNTKKVNKIANKNNSTKPGNTKAPIVTNSPKPSTDNTKKIVSISPCSDSPKYVFIEKGSKLVDNDNRGGSGGVDIDAYDLQFLDVKYADGSEEIHAYQNYEHPEDISYDFSQINYNQVGTYKLKISWYGCSCEVPVVVAEEKEEGLFKYMTDGNVAKLLGMRGDIEVEDDDYSYKYSGTTLSLPDTLGGAKVVQGTPQYYFSMDNIEKVEFPKYYVENAQYIAWGYYECPKLKEVVINNPDSGYIVKDNVLFAEGGEVLCLYPAGLQNTSYSIPEGVKEVTGCGMDYNQYLKEVTYPKSFIGYALRRGWPMENPGAGLPNLKTINVASENPWVSKDGVMYQREEDNKLALATYPRKKTDLSFSVGEDVSWIPSGTGMDRNSFLENIVFKSGKTTIGVEALNGNSIKNVYLDFEDEDTGDTGLYLDGFKFDYYGSEKEHSHNIYMRKGTSLKHIAEELQAKVQYY